MVCPANLHPFEAVRKGLMAKQTRITIRQDGLLLLRSRISRRAWCPACAAEGDMITLDHAVGMSPTAKGWLESLPLHRSEASDGSRLICVNSLTGCLANKKSS
jgi:hypothetical protein